MQNKSLRVFCILDGKVNEQHIRSILRPGPKYVEKGEKGWRAIWWKVGYVLCKGFRSCRLSL